MPEKERMFELKLLMFNVGLANLSKPFSKNSFSLVVLCDWLCHVAKYQIKGLSRTHEHASSSNRFSRLIINVKTKRNPKPCWQERFSAITTDQFNFKNAID